MDYIGTIIYKDNLDADQYEAIANWCTDQQLGYIEDRGSYYEVLAIQKADQKMRLIQEKANIERWLFDHDYIGIKIATGRASIEEYADAISEMNQKAARINEINQLLDTLA